MRKYDCSKSKDLIHELNRMCSSNIKNCCNCSLHNPFYHCSMEANKISNDVITIVQTWSDEHPEKPKLTKEEYIFLQGFMSPIHKSISCTKSNALLLITPNDWTCLNSDMFKFIKPGETWVFEELLKLEVEKE